MLRNDSRSFQRVEKKRHRIELSILTIKLEKAVVSEAEKAISHGN